MLDKGGEVFMEIVSVDNGVTVITCTNKPSFMRNVINNFNRQVWKQKELIIILNNDRMNTSDWEPFLRNKSNITIYKLSEKMSLGACLNFAIKKAKNNYIAKFDDDDYYGPAYLSEAIRAFQKSGADVIGKRTYYIYLVFKKLLMLRFPNGEKRWTNYIAGGTIIAKRSVFTEIAFKDLAVGTDRQFLEDCHSNNLKIYSTSRFNYVYMRRKSNWHTWKTTLKYLISTSKKVAVTRNYRKYINENPRKYM